MTLSTGVKERVRIAVSIGDPRGIGPEIVRRAVDDADLARECELIIVGPTGCGVRVDVPVGDWNSTKTAADAGRLSGLAIARVVAMAQEAAVQGIVTAPID